MTAKKDFEELRDYYTFVENQISSVKDAINRVDSAVVAMRTTILTTKRSENALEIAQVLLEQDLCKLQALYENLKPQMQPAYLAAKAEDELSGARDVHSSN